MWLASKKFFLAFYEKDSLLWKLLTSKNVTESNDSDQTDSNDDIEGNGKFKERALKESSSPSPTGVVNIAPGEGQIPVSFNWEPNW